MTGGIQATAGGPTGGVEMGMTRVCIFSFSFSFYSIYYYDFSIEYYVGFLVSSS